MRISDWSSDVCSSDLLAVGVVDVESGNFAYWDTRGRGGNTRIDARHIMASGALPPGLPPIEIDGRWYWDGGIVSNTPLAHVLDHQSADMLVFQVDLFPAEGPMPRRSEEHTSELQSLMRISYAVFCLKKKKKTHSIKKYE